MKMHSRLKKLMIAIGVASLGQFAMAHDGQHVGGIQTAPETKVTAPFDIFHTSITTEGNIATFHIAVSGKAGANKPKKSGKLAGSTVFSYVWPTTMDPSVVGFEAKSGILAFAVTSHPDFNDTPLFTGGGGEWHTHWVVLQPDDACGKGALKVVDIPEGAKPKLGGFKSEVQHLAQPVRCEDDGKISTTAARRTHDAGESAPARSQPASYCANAGAQSQFLESRGGAQWHGHGVRVQAC